MADNPAWFGFSVSNGWGQERKAIGTETVPASTLESHLFLDAFGRWQYATSELSGYSS